MGIALSGTCRGSPIARARRARTSDGGGGQGEDPAGYCDEISERARRHNGMLDRFLFWFTQGDHALAEDLAQRSSWRRRGGGRPPRDG